MKPSFLMIQKMKKTFGNNCKYNYLKMSMLKKCEWCGGLFVMTHHSQKFCNPRCYREHRREYKSEWKRTHKTKQELGEGRIKGRANKDFEKEARIVRNEKRRFGL